MTAFRAAIKDEVQTCNRFAVAHSFHSFQRPVARAGIFAPNWKSAEN